MAIDLRKSRKNSTDTVVGLDASNESQPKSASRRRRTRNRRNVASTETVSIQKKNNKNLPNTKINNNIAPEIFLNKLM